MDSRQRSRQLFQERQTALKREAKDRPCADCGVKYPYYVMQFDHIRGPKRFNLGGFTARGTELVLAEIAKCDVVCSNCHAERTHRRRHLSSSTDRAGAS